MKGRYHIHTPLIHSIPLSKRINKNVYLKLDLLQQSGSFKDRGIGNLMSHTYMNGVTSFVGTSGGNAGISMATIANSMGLPCTVVVPETASHICINLMKQRNAEVIIKGKDVLEATEYGMELSQERKDSFYIPPYNHKLIWEGHSSIIDEIKMDLNGTIPDAIICSVGGGGLFNGICMGLMDNKWDTTVITSETIGCDSFYQSKKYGDIVELKEITSIATTLGVRQLNKECLEYSNMIHQCIAERISDKDAVYACGMFLNDHRMLVEPACAASLGLLYNNAECLQNFENIVLIVCGGNAFDLDSLMKYIKLFNIQI